MVAENKRKGKSVVDENLIFQSRSTKEYLFVFAPFVMKFLSSEIMQYEGTL
jgi:hypothetical protein